MALYPVFLNLRDRKCVVVGGGEVAMRKARALQEAGACVYVVSPAAVEPLQPLCGMELHEAPYSCESLAGASLVVACTDDSELNGRVYEDCRSRGILCNVVDDPDRCDFQVPSVMRRGRLQVAVSTAGASPALAATVRDELAESFDSAFEQWLEELASLRRRMMSHVVDRSARRRLLKELGSAKSLALFRRTGLAGWRPWSEEIAASAGR